MPRHALLLAVLAASFLVASPASAEEDFFEPVSMGMGGAVRILGSDTAAIHLNPAAMTGKPRYIAGSSYTFYGRARSHTLATGAFDSRTSAFALGTEYTIMVFEPPFAMETDLNWFPTDGSTEVRDKRTWQRWDIAAAYGLLQRRINIGLSARIVRQQFAIRDPRTFFTLDAGVVFWPAHVFAIGISAQNIIPTKDDRFPTRLSPGIALELENFLRIGVDVVFDFMTSEIITTDLHAGAEVTLFRLISIRAGFYSDRRFTETYVTWGLGLYIERARLNISYAMRIEAGPMDRPIRQDKPEPNSRILNKIGFDLRF